MFSYGPNEMTISALKAEMVQQNGSLAILLNLFILSNLKTFKDLLIRIIKIS
ncbi:hypothetical protein GCM10007103_20090 [Salinimicrobium marinum]|uniref:Uncharacterized protein n=1 Tax=Salinimicrobium marinum TaxID=680283 RepID=A0A918SFY9_9FLAO|nr:hypothetical protein GCM10007103_20090 [Salinimicrobium marinum]